MNSLELSFSYNRKEPSVILFLMPKATLRILSDWHVTTNHGFGQEQLTVEKGAEILLDVKPIFIVNSLFLHFCFCFLSDHCEKEYFALDIYERLTFQVLSLRHIVMFIQPSIFLQVFMLLIA